MRFLPESPNRFGRAAGLFFALGWLVFLYFAIAEVLTGRHPRGEVAGGLVGVAAFVAVYVWFWLRIGRFRTTARRGAWVAAGSLLLLAMLLSLADGATWGQLYIYAALVAGAAFDWRWSSALVVAIALITIANAAVGGATPALVPIFGIYVLLVGEGAVAVTHIIGTNHQLREAREELAQLAVAEERLRFARDLHDLLGHSLSVIVLKAELASRLAEAAPERVAEQVRDIERVGREALREVRDAVSGYRQASLSGELESARTTLGAAGVVFGLEPAGGALPPLVDSTLAWAVREGVTNIVRHSRARHARARVVRDSDHVELELLDDGVGCDDCSGGHGLSGLRERVAAHGGALDFGPRPEGGFRVVVSLPLQDSPDRSAASVV